MHALRRTARERLGILSRGTRDGRIQCKVPVKRRLTTRPSQRALSASSAASSSTSSRGGGGDPLIARRNRDIQSSWKTVQGVLLQVPVGDLTTALWHEADEALKKTQAESSSVALAWELLDRLHQEVLIVDSKKTSREATAISTDALNWTVNAWRLFCTENTAANKLPLSHTDIIEKLATYSAAGLVHPNVHTYTMVIGALQHTEHSSTAPDVGESILETMLASARKGFKSVHPNTITINNLLVLWAKSGRPEATEMAEYHAAVLKEWYKESNDPDLRPDEHVFVQVIRAWAKSGDPAAGRRAAALLEELCKTDGLKPNTVVYSTVLDAMAKSGEVEQAHAVLNEMLRLSAAGDDSVQPDVYSFSCVLAAYAAQRNAPAVARVLEEMEVLYEQTQNVAFRPNTVCYSILIGALAATREPRQAEAVLQRMLESPHDSVQPNLISFNKILHAWARMGTTEGIERATAILERMTVLHKNGESGFKPNVKSYNILLDCYANSPTPRKYAPMAQSKLEWMHLQEDPAVKPGTVSYNTVLRAWSKAGAPQKAEALLQSLLRMYRNDKTIVEPHVDMFITVIAGWASSKERQAPKRIEALLKSMQDLHKNEGLDTPPTLIAYNAFLDCLSHSTERDAAQRAESEFRNMLQEYKSGVKELKPDVVSYTSVITAWSRSKHQDAPDRAEALFREMQRSDNDSAQPNRITYNALMSTFSRHKRPFKVQTMFDEMEQLFEESGDARVEPNFFIYTTLLQSWSMAAEPEKAALVLQEMLRKYESGELERQPGTRSFNTVLQAWCRSSRPDAADKAEDGLETMHTLASSDRFCNVRPDLFTYSCVISAHVRSSAIDSAERAHKLLERLNTLYTENGDRNCQPDLRVYSDVICLWTKSSDQQASERIGGLIADLRHVGGWRKQGYACSQRIMDALAKSDLVDARKHAESLGNIMNTKRS